MNSVIGEYRRSLQSIMCAKYFTDYSTMLHSCAVTKSRNRQILDPINPSWSCEDGVTRLIQFNTHTSIMCINMNLFSEVSYMKAIDVWMGACMFFVFSVMIEFTVVNFAQRQGNGLKIAYHPNTAILSTSSSTKIK